MRGALRRVLFTALVALMTAGCFAPQPSTVGDGDAVPPEVSRGPLSVCPGPDGTWTLGAPGAGLFGEGRHVARLRDGDRPGWRAEPPAEFDLTSRQPGEPHSALVHRGTTVLVGGREGRTGPASVGGRRPVSTSSPRERGRRTSAQGRPDRPLSEHGGLPHRPEAATPKRSIPPRAPSVPASGRTDAEWSTSPEATTCRGGPVGPPGLRAAGEGLDGQPPRRAGSRCGWERCARADRRRALPTHRHVRTPAGRSRQPTGFGDTSSAAVRTAAQVEDVGGGHSAARRTDGAHVVGPLRSGRTRGGARARRRARATRVRAHRDGVARSAGGLGAGRGDGGGLPVRRAILLTPLPAPLFRLPLGLPQGVVHGRGRGGCGRLCGGHVAGVPGGARGRSVRAGRHGHAARRAQQGDECEGHRPQVHALVNDGRLSRTRPVRAGGWWPSLSRAGRPGRRPGHGRWHGPGSPPRCARSTPTPRRRRAAHR